MKTVKSVMLCVCAASLVLALIGCAPQADAPPEPSSPVTYAAYLDIKTTEQTALCLAAEGNSAVQETLNADTRLVAHSLIKDADGEYWYETDYEGKNLYVSAMDTTMIKQRFDDVSAVDLMTPAVLEYGSDFAIKGSISTGYNELKSVTVSVYHKDAVSDAPAIRIPVDPGTKSYELLELDELLNFGELEAGPYTIELTAQALSYYIDDTGVLSSCSDTVILHRKECVISNVEQPPQDAAMGVDVSSWKGSIDWAAAAPEIDFAMLRIGSKGNPDTKFADYAAGCGDNGIAYGAYYVSSAANPQEALAEAELVIAALDGFDPGMGVYFDVEYSLHEAVTSEQLQAIVRTFCEAIQAAGYKAGVYSYAELFETHFTDSYFHTLPKWVSQIDVSNCTYTGGVTIWQYSWKGSVSGISGDVDCNFYYGLLPGQKDA